MGWGLPKALSAPMCQCLFPHPQCILSALPSLPLVSRAGRSRLWALGPRPAPGPGPGPRAPGCLRPVLGPRAWTPGPGPWALAPGPGLLGPGPWAPAPGPGPEPWGAAPGPLAPRSGPWALGPRPPGHGNALNWAGGGTPPPEGGRGLGGVPWLSGIPTGVLRLSFWAPWDPSPGVPWWSLGESLVGP